MPLIRLRYFVHISMIGIVLIVKTIMIGILVRRLIYIVLFIHLIFNSFSYLLICIHYNHITEWFSNNKGRSFKIFLVALLNL